MNIPNDLKYSQDHEWVRVEDNLAVIGITDFAQTSLGDVVFVDLPEVGTEISLGAEFGAIESVKAVSDIYAPVSGVIIEVNELLADAPETVNQSPYGSGWIIKVELSNKAELDQLLDSDAYGKFCAEEGH